MRLDTMLAGPEGYESSSRFILFLGVTAVIAFFLFVVTGIAMNLWEWDKWEGPMDWVKWLLLSVIVPYAINRFKEQWPGDQTNNEKIKIEYEGEDLGSL